MSWRYKGGPGSGALADVGSHLAYVAEFLCGDISPVTGGRLSTVINERPLPLGAVMGHDHAAVSDNYEAVENDDYAAFPPSSPTAPAASRSPGSRPGTPTACIFEVFCENGAARFDQRRPAEIQLFLHDGSGNENGYRQVILGPEHPYLAGGLAMDAPERRLRPERRVRLPGPGVPRRGRRHQRRRVAAPLRHLRRGRAQHGTARRRHRVRRCNNGKMITL